MTRRTRNLLILVLIGLVIVGLIWADPIGRRRSPGDARIAYGWGRSQHVDLWLPKGPGPFPVVVMVHGGCWRSANGVADGMNPIADDLRRRGIAVWNIEYRGINQAPFPATFQDVAAAADALRDAARKYPLDLRRVVAVGHSAGGHLVLWLAARSAIAPTSPLHSTDPLKLAAVISLGGPPDLEADRRELAACGPDAVPQLVGEAGRPNAYADTSPALLPQPAIPVTLISGDSDTIVPPALVDAYAQRAGRGATEITMKGASHLDLIAPGTPAWHQAATLIQAAAR